MDPITQAVLHQLATHTLSLSFFATHYGSLTDDFAYHPNIRNMHMKTMVDDEKQEVRRSSITPHRVRSAKEFIPVTKHSPVLQLVFLYKLVSGIASSSFGTHVASLAGVPTTVVDRADVVSKDFAKQFKEKIEGKRKQARLPLVLQADFAYLMGLVSGKDKLPESEAKAWEVLKGLKEAARMGLLHAATAKA
jgi:DNA mismatch repair protein MSH6